MGRFTTGLVALVFLSLPCRANLCDKALPLLLGASHPFTEKQISTVLYQIAEEALLKTRAQRNLLEDLAPEVHSKAKAIIERLANENPYFDLIDLTNPPEGNIHLLYEDVPIRIETPRTGQTTLWDLMTVESRRALINRFERVFRTLPYQANLQGTLRRPTSDVLVLSSILYGIPGAFSPILALAAARNSRPIGICRHANCLLIGLAAAIGAPASSLRIVRGELPGADSGRGHLWGEIQYEINMEWEEFDATPRSELVLAPATLDLLVSMLGKMPNTNHVNQRRYSQNLEEIDLLSVPDRMR